LVTATTTLAADSAERRIIGFSPDGKWFAYEQFGVEDGSGFPYHSVEIIDVINDAWAPGTPISERIDDETATPFQVRNKVRAKAAPELARRKIINPGHILASNPSTELEPDASEVRFHIHRNWTGPQTPYVLKVETRDIPKPETCAYSDFPIKLFSLKLTTEDGAEHEIYRDKKLPKSRSCAHSYRIADVLVHEERMKPDHLVVLLHVFSQGFEGSDARFMAVAIAVP
jgi:predicted secreted protein